MAAGITEGDWQALEQAAAARRMTPGSLLWSLMSQAGYTARLEYAAPMRGMTPTELMWELAARERAIEKMVEKK